MARTKKQEATAALKVWGEEYPACMQVAVVQDNGTRRLAILERLRRLDAELKGLCEVTYLHEPDDDEPLNETELVNIKRIRKRAIETKKTSNPLRVLLADSEKLDTGAAVADGLANIGSLEAELATVRKQYQGKIQAAQAEVSSKSELLRNGYEIRPVACTLLQDFDTGLATETRNDTGKQVEQRQLRSEERERELTLFPGAHSGDTPEEAVDVPENMVAPGARAEPPTEEEIQQALALFVETQRVSTAAVQRRLQIGFTPAVNIIQELETRGMVTKPTGPQNTRELTDQAPKAEGGVADGEGGETFPLSD